VAGSGQGKRNQAGEDPHPKAELRRRLVAIAEQRGGGCDGDRGATAKAAARLGFSRQEAAAAGLTDPRARGGHFIGWSRGLGIRAHGSARRGSCAVARLGCESESGSCWRSRMTPIDRSRLSEREREERRAGPPVGLGREGARPAGPRGGGKK
jgi:hypothetical protein